MIMEATWLGKCLGYQMCKEHKTTHAYAFGSFFEVKCDWKQELSRMIGCFSLASEANPRCGNFSLYKHKHTKPKYILVDASALLIYIYIILIKVVCVPSATRVYYGLSCRPTTSTAKRPVLSTIW